MSKGQPNLHDPQFTTAEVINKLGHLGLTKDTLFYYENKAKILPRRKTPKGRRRARQYDYDQIADLTTILRCVKAGFSLDAIKKAFKAYSAPRAKAPEWTVLPTDALRVLTEQLATVRSSGLLDDTEAVYKRIREAGQKIFGCERFTIGPENPLLDGAIERCHGADLISRLGAWPASAGRAPLSLLEIRLTDRRGRLLGTCQAWDRRMTKGAEGDITVFDSVDEALAVMFARDMSPMLGALRVADVSRELTEEAQSRHGLGSYLQALLNRSSELLGADRGDVFLLDETRKQLILARQNGTSSIPIGQVVPDVSVSGWVFRTRKPAVIPDVNDREKVPYYFRGSDKTRSEIAVPLLRGSGLHGEPIAVLNLESEKPAHFIEEDVEVLQRLSSSAAIAAQLTETYDAILAGPHAKGALQGILDSVHGGLGFDEGALFIADFRRSTLEYAASSPKLGDGQAVTCELTAAPEKLLFPARIFVDRMPRFIQNPWDDAALRQFAVNKPAVGAPLLFGPTPVGVLIAWSRTSRRHPTEDDRKLLQHYASLAVTTMAIAAGDSHRHECFVLMRRILDQLQRHEPRQDMLDTILQGVVMAGFDRARVFSYREDDRLFHCDGSYGVESPNIYRRKGIYVNGSRDGKWPPSPFAQLTVKDFEGGRLEPRVRVPDEIGGEDPYGREFGKPDHLPWAVAPLGVHGRLRGHIAADNKLSKLEITPNQLEYLALYQALAALVIADTSGPPPKASPASP